MTIQTGKTSAGAFQNRFFRNVLIVRGETDSVELGALKGHLEEAWNGDKERTEPMVL